MFIFGVMAFFLGLLGILKQDILLSLLGFTIPQQRPPSDYTLVFVTASSMASLNMGAYYVLAALNNMKQFYAWTVPFRFVTFTVFTLTVTSGIAPAPFFGVGLWELIGALAVGVALIYERQRGIK